MLIISGSRRVNRCIDGMLRTYVPISFFFYSYVVSAWLESVLTRTKALLMTCKWYDKG